MAVARIPLLSVLGSWQDSGVAHSLAGRAESRIQARLLSLLRDDGPLSRAELADRLSVSRTTIAGAEWSAINSTVTEPPALVCFSALSTRLLMIVCRA